MRGRESIGKILEGLKEDNGNIKKYLDFYIKLINLRYGNENFSSLLGNAGGETQDLFNNLGDIVRDLKDMDGNYKGVNSKIREFNNAYGEFRESFKKYEKLKEYPNIARFVDSGLDDILDDSPKVVLDKERDDICTKLKEIVNEGEPTGKELKSLMDRDYKARLAYLHFRTAIADFATALGGSSDDLKIVINDLLKFANDFLEKAKIFKAFKMSKGLDEALNGEIQKLMNRL